MNNEETSHYFNMHCGFILQTNLLFHSMPWENLSTTGISANWVMNWTLCKQRWTGPCFLYLQDAEQPPTNNVISLFYDGRERKWSWITLYCLYCLFFGIWLHIKTDTVSNYVRKGYFGKKQREVTFLFDIEMFRVVLMKHWLFSKIHVHLVWKWK